MLNPPPQEVLERIPKLYETEPFPPAEKIIHLHFFIGNCHWYIAEFNGGDIFFGFANLGDPEMAEWGYIPYSELRGLMLTTGVIDHETEQLIGELPVYVEWDEYWQPKPFGEIKEDPR